MSARDVIGRAIHSLLVGRDLGQVRTVTVCAAWPCDTARLIYTSEELSDD